MTLPIIKSTVTYLEMLQNPQLEDVTLDGFTLKREEKPDVKTYIDLYREIGRDYIWNYRPSQTEKEIEDIIQSGRTRLYYLYDNNSPNRHAHEGGHPYNSDSLPKSGLWIPAFAGRTAERIVSMAELDVTKVDDVELVHFGLLPEYINSGIGKKFLHKVIYLMWHENINRLWLSTCGLDHPKAIKFYENAGFRVFKTREGEFKDYRYTGFYNMNDAPQIPHGVGRHE